MTISNRKSKHAGVQLNGRRINWNQVHYFSEIAAAGSIKDAAVKLELNSSTLSLHLSELEQDLEVRLFHRQHRKLVLTPEGTRLFRHTQAMFETGQRLIDVVSPVPLGCYPVSVALVPSPSLPVANRILGMLLHLHGPFNMKAIRTDYCEIEKGLSEARFDFGFSDRIPERKDIVYRHISRGHVSFFVAPKWAGVKFSALLQKLPLLICSAEPTHRSLVEQALQDAEFIPSSVVTSDYPSTLTELCHQGAGIGVFSDMAFQTPEIRGLSSLRVPSGAPKLRDDLYVLWSAGAENTAALRILQEALKER